MVMVLSSASLMFIVVAQRGGILLFVYFGWLGVAVVRVGVGGATTSRLGEVGALLCWVRDDWVFRVISLM
jgi:hypothetical protein